MSRAAFDWRARWTPEEGFKEGGSLRGGVCLRAGPSGESVSVDCWGGDEELEGSSGWGLVGVRDEIEVTVRVLVGIDEGIC